MLGLGSRDQDAAVDVEGAAVELLDPEQIGDRLARESALEESFEALGGLRIEPLFLMGENSRLAHPEHLRKEQDGLAGVGLESRGRQASEVSHVIVTHVHLDHSGGAGELMKQMPNATLVAHPRGARHDIAVVVDGLRSRPPSDDSYPRARAVAPGTSAAEQTRRGEPAVQG